MPERAHHTTIHWRALDAVRGVSVLAVVCWHVYRLTVVRGMDAHNVPFYFWPLGTARLGVDVFFVLSGLLVVQSWQSARVRASNGFLASWDFISRRARRILPAYWLSLVVLIPLVGASLFDHPRRILAFFTLNQYVKFWLPDRLNPVTWSLTTEWHFYLLVPIIVWLLRRVGRWPMLAGCIALTLLWWMHPPFLLPSSFVFGRLDQFVAGAIVGQLVRESPRHPVVRAVHAPGVLPVALTGLVVVGSYHGKSLGMANHPIVDALVHPIFGLLTAAILLRLLTSRSAYAASSSHLRMLEWFGTISFGLYLWHYPILDQGLRWTRASVPIPSAWSTVLAVPVLVACAIGVAWLSYVLVERPFTKRRERPEPVRRAGTLSPWPSPRSWESRPSTASR
jgi:peptidoglycan/LPS O-acetylase OafA/YrhL